MVKSKRAREAAESVVDPSSAEAVNGSSATHEKQVKKRKRDDAAEEDAAATETKKSKKDKKEKKDKKDKKSKKHDQESRKEKKDKRKNLQDLPEEVMEDVAVEDKEAGTPPKAEAKVTNGAEGDAEAKRKEEKRARKQAKREEKEKKQQQTKAEADSTSKSNDKASAPSATAPSVTGQGDNNEKTEEDPIDLDDSSAKKDRHIVFVGNLPFSATAASISAHFATLSPVAVRCLRNRDDPNPCRGIAFVEFSKVWHQRTCLDKFHHSTFDDGVSPARKINVELT